MAYDREKGRKGRGGMKRTDEQLQELLLRELSKAGRLRRKQLIEAGIAVLGMERGADADLSPGAPLTMMKSRLGMVLTGLIHAGSIREDEAGFLQLERAQDIEFAPAAIRAFIIRTLEERGLLGKQELYRLAEICFGTDRTATKQDDNALRSVMGRCLVEMEKERAVVKTTRGYRPGAPGDYPATELGGYLRQAAEGGDLKRCFLEAIHTKGGEWFESYCVRLLRAWRTVRFSWLWPIRIRRLHVFPVTIAFNAFLFLWYSVGVSPPCVSGRGESGRALLFPVGPAVSCGMILAYNQAVKERGFPL